MESIIYDSGDIVCGIDPMVGSNLRIFILPRGGDQEFPSYNDVIIIVNSASKIYCS